MVGTRRNALTAVAAFTALTCQAVAGCSSTPVEVGAESPRGTACNPLDGSKKGTVPNLVGLNLLAAEKSMCAAGFYVVDKQPIDGAAGLVDSTWVVQSQAPKPEASRLGVDTPITLALAPSGTSGAPPLPQTGPAQCEDKDHDFSRSDGGLGGPTSSADLRSVTLALDGTDLVVEWENVGRVVGPPRERLGDTSGLGWSVFLHDGEGLVYQLMVDFVERPTASIYNANLRSFQYVAEPAILENRVAARYRLQDLPALPKVVRWSGLGTFTSARGARPNITTQLVEDDCPELSGGPRLGGGEHVFPFRPENLAAYRAAATPR